MSEYNENIGKAVKNFERIIKKAGFSFDTEHKILSIVMSLEYQVEMGDAPPVSVIRHLQAAIRSWIEDYGQNQKKLLASLNKCVDNVLKEIGSAEQKD